MRRQSLIVVLLLAMAAAAAGWWWMSQGTTLHVAAADTSADTDGTGSADAPFRTISAAVERAQTLTAQGEPVTIRIAPGTYRESVIVNGSPDDAALVIEGAGPGEVVISGADPFTDWEPVPGSPGVLTHPWQESWGLAELPTEGWADYFADHDVSDIARRQEAVWVGADIVRQVLTREEVLAQPATFYVDEASDAIVLHPAGPLGPDGAEVATRATGVLIGDRRGVTLRGLRVERVATALQDSAITIADSTDVTVENTEAVWSSWGGLALQRVEGATLRQVATNDNGVIGLSIYRTRDVDVIDMENSRNNTWRGVWAGYLGWETGAKVFQARDLRFQRYVAKENAAGGLWLDTDIADVTIEEAVLAHNLRDGLFLEAIQGPVVIRDAVICGNGEDGIVDGKSDRVTITNSRIFGNGDAQVLFSGSAGGRPFTTYDTGTDLNIRSQGWTLRGNTIASGDDADLVQSDLDAADWEVVAGSLESEENRWSAPQPHEFHAAGAAHDLAGWRALTGQDGESTFATQPPPDCPR